MRELYILPQRAGVAGCRARDRRACVYVHESLPGYRHSNPPRAVKARLSQVFREGVQHIVRHRFATSPEGGEREGGSKGDNSISRKTSDHRRAAAALSAVCKSGRVLVKTRYPEPELQLLFLAKLLPLVHTPKRTSNQFTFMTLDRYSRSTAFNIDYIIVYDIIYFSSNVLRL